MDTHRPPVTTSDSISAPAAARPLRRIWAAAAISAAVASLLTTAIAALANRADRPLVVDGDEIPMWGYAQLTLVGALIGAILATVLHKRARAPKRTFLVVTAVLTAVSVVPDLLVEATRLTKVLLIATHVVAALVIVPAIARNTARMTSPRTGDLEAGDSAAAPA